MSVCYGKYRGIFNPNSCSGLFLNVKVLRGSRPSRGNVNHDDFIIEFTSRKLVIAYTPVLNYYKGSLIFLGSSPVLDLSLAHNHSPITFSH